MLIVKAMVALFMACLFIFSCTPASNEIEAGKNAVNSTLVQVDEQDDDTHLSQG